MAEDSCLADDVECYSVAPITLGPHSTVSQYTYLCTASHDYEDPDFRLLAKPIRIGARAWVAAGTFVGPGVTIAEGAVVGARSAVFKDVEQWTVVAGNPARYLKRRRMRVRE